MLDPLSPEFLRDPYPHYRWLRDNSPCHHHQERNLWILSRYDDVVAAAKNHAVFSSTGGVGLDWNQRPMMPMYDPPEHTRMRRLVARHFTPAAAVHLTARIESQIGALMDPLIAAGGGELIDDFAIPLSLGTIAEVIGVPLQDRDRLRQWSQGTIEDLAGGLDEAAHARVDALLQQFVTYLKESMAGRRASELADTPDVLSRLLHASDEEKLTPRELVAFGVLLLVAGFETTVNAIANGVLAFLGHPEQCALLREKPELVPNAVEEVIRFDGPVQSFFRNTLSETTVAGVTIPKGVKVMLLFASANRDERRFEAPDELHIDRKGLEHIGFGAGIHYCLGAPLARLQMTCVARACLERLQRVESAGEATRYHSVLFRGVKRLPIRLVAR